MVRFSSRKQIAKYFQISEKEVSSRFPDATPRFFSSLLQLVGRHPGRTWEEICSAILEARAQSQHHSHIRHFGRKLCEIAGSLLQSQRYPKTWATLKSLSKAAEEMVEVISADHESLRELGMNKKTIIWFDFLPGLALINHNHNSGELYYDRRGTEQHLESRILEIYPSFPTLSWHYTPTEDRTGTRIDTDLQFATRAFCFSLGCRLKQLSFSAWGLFLEAFTKSEPTKGEQWHIDSHISQIASILQSFSTKSVKLLQYKQSSMPTNIVGPVIFLSVEDLAILRDCNHLSIFASKSPPTGRKQRGIRDYLGIPGSTWAVFPGLDINFGLLLAAFNFHMGVEIASPDKDMSQDLLGLWRRVFLHLLLSYKSSTKYTFWIGLSLEKHISENPFTSIKVCFSDNEIFGKPDAYCLSKGVLHTMRTRLGSSFIELHGEDEAFIHQSVLMALLTSEYAAINIHFMDWEKTKKIFIDTLLRCCYGEVILLLSLNASHAFESKNLYKQINVLKQLGIRIRAYPSEFETQWYNGKIGDIRVSDEIAADLGVRRPKTCFGQGICKLTNPKTPVVLKRTESSGAADVHFQDKVARNLLQCILPTQDSPRYPNPFSVPFYFHQELVKSMPEYGELRVTVDSQGEILAIIRTKFNWGQSDRPMAFQEATTDDFQWHSSNEKEREKKMAELRDSVRHFHLSIVSRDEVEAYETIRLVGARYDFAIIEGPQGLSFFCNEITRALAADLMSSCLPQPHLRIFRAWATEIARNILTTTPIGAKGSLKEST